MERSPHRRRFFAARASTGVYDRYFLIFSWQGQAASWIPNSRARFTAFDPFSCLKRRDIENRLADSLNRNRPKIVLNMTTLKMGGVLQPTVSFISHLETALNDFHWHILLSKVVATELSNVGIESNCTTETFQFSPAHSYQARRRVSDAVNLQKPDMLFTFAGPSYIRPPVSRTDGRRGWMGHPCHAGRVCVDPQTT